MEASKKPTVYTAVKAKDMELLEDLINRGADIEIKNPIGGSPLSHAAEEGLLSFVKLLLEKGATIDSKNNFGATPLRGAVVGGHVDVIKHLLEKGGDIESKDGFGGSLLLC